jgi:hypothetical protein
MFSITEDFPDDCDPTTTWESQHCCTDVAASLGLPIQGGHPAPVALRQQSRTTYNLRQVEGVISDGVENQVLEPVDNVEQLLTQRRHDAVAQWMRVLLCV